MTNEISLDIEKILLKEQLFKEMVKQKNDINMFSQTDSVDASINQAIMSFSKDINQLESGQHEVESSPSGQKLVEKLHFVDTNNPVSPTMSIDQHGTQAYFGSIKTEGNENQANVVFSNTLGSVEQINNNLAEMMDSPGPIRQEDSRL